MSNVKDESGDASYLEHYKSVMYDIETVVIDPVTPQEAKEKGLRGGVEMKRNSTFTLWLKAIQRSQQYSQIYKDYDSTLQYLAEMSKSDIGKLQHMKYNGKIKSVQSERGVSAEQLLTDAQ